MTDYSDRVLKNALAEDIGNGDVTSSALIPDNSVSGAVLIAKEEMVLAGLTFAERVFHLVDADINFRVLKKEGSRVRAGIVLARIKGRTRSILLAERTALNLLQRLSGIATLTDSYVRAVKGLSAEIADTRKTAPGLRYFDKYAVRIGGGRNHRYGLFDGVLIKDNHIAAVGGVGRAVRLARARSHHLLKIEVEVNSLDQVREALTAGADVIMLDNMPITDMKKAVAIIRKKGPGTIIEASGTIHAANVRQTAGTGVDLISIGALTHSAAAADISLEITS